ncbi:hypothetical protein ACQ4PT_041632 [Festuca glaucescens]
MASQAEAPKAMEMEAPGGDAVVRPALVRAVAPRTAAMAQDERDLTRLAVVAVVVGFNPDLELFEVNRAFALQFAVAEEALHVSVFAPGEFLLRFNEVEACNRAVSWQGALTMGSVSFMLSPWTRFRRGRVEKMFFKARVCLEGVPRHAWQLEAVRGLFGDTDIIDGVDTSECSEQDMACF